MKLEKTKEYIKKPLVTPLTLVFMVANLFVHIVESDTWYEATGKIALVVGLILSGTSMTDIKELMRRMTIVLKDPKTNLLEKMRKIFDIVITGSAMLGILHEETLEYPIDDFITKIEPDKVD